MADPLATISQQVSQLESFWNYLTGFEFKSFFVNLFNIYMPYGLPFWILGFIVIFLAHLKTKNLAFASMLGATYFFIIGNSGLVTNAISATAMQYVGLFIGVVIGFYLYRSLRG